MPTMVERIIDALLKAELGPDGAAIEGFDERRAIAVLKAIQEPSTEMTIAGAHGADIRPSEARAVYYSMIKSALSQAKALA